jgi:hypothetical protein
MEETWFDSDTNYIKLAGYGKPLYALIDLLMSVVLHYILKMILLLKNKKILDVR